MSRLSPGHMLVGIGGVVLIISLFLDWNSGVSVSAGSVSISTSQTAFDAFSGMDIIMLIIAVIAVAWAVLTAMDAGAGFPATSGWILTLLGLIVVGWALGWDLENGSAGFGSWLGLLAAIAITLGAYAAASEAGVLAPSLRLGGGAAPGATSVAGAAAPPPPPGTTGGAGSTGAGEGTRGSSPPPPGP